MALGAKRMMLPRIRNLTPAEQRQYVLDHAEKLGHPTRNLIHEDGESYELGMLGWRFNSVTDDGRILGLQVGANYTTPVTSCAPWTGKMAGVIFKGMNEHADSAIPAWDCFCGYRIVGDLDELVEYERERRPDSYMWGYGKWANPQIPAPTGRIMLRAAVSEPNRRIQRSWGDPESTFRARELIYLGPAYLRHRDANLAPLIAQQYPLNVTVLDSDDFAEIHQHHTSETTTN